MLLLFVCDSCVLLRFISAPWRRVLFGASAGYRRRSVAAAPPSPSRAVAQQLGVLAAEVPPRGKPLLGVAHVAGPAACPVFFFFRCFPHQISLLVWFVQCHAYLFCVVNPFVQVCFAATVWLLELASAAESQCFVLMRLCIVAFIQGYLVRGQL